MRNNIYDNTKIKGMCSVIPQSFSVDGVDVDGTAIDSGVNLTEQSGALYAFGATSTGGATPATLQVRLQESDNRSTGWADALDNTGTVIGFTLDVQSADAEGIARVEGLGLNRKRYLRAVVLPTLTGGSYPASIGFAQIILGPSLEKPVGEAVSNT